MSKEFFSRQLSACEVLIMKAVWNYDGDIPLQKLMESLRDDFHKEYARTTVATFLTRLSNKGYVQTYRKGRVSFTHALKDEEDYKQRLVQEEADFWFGGSEADLISALIKDRKLSKKEIEKIQSAISDL